MELSPFFETSATNTHLLSKILLCIMKMSFPDSAIFMMWSKFVLREWHGNLGVFFPKKKIKYLLNCFMHDMAKDIKKAFESRYLCTSPPLETGF